VTAPLEIGAGPISIADVVAVADGRPSVLAPASAARLAAGHALVRERAGGDRVYGLNTGVGHLRDVPVGVETIGEFNRLLVASHRVGFGEPAPRRVVRAAMLCRAQGLAQGRGGVRPEVVTALLEALADDDVPDVPLHGSLGQSDLAPLAEIAEHLVRRGIVLEAREGLALVNANSFALGWACLALDEARGLVAALDASAALCLEATLAQVSAVDPAVAEARPHDGLAATIAAVRALLAGGALLEGRTAPRSLQDPLSVRVVPSTHGAARDALAEAERIATIELRAGSDNPLLTSDGRLLSNGNHDPAGLAAALDYARLGVGAALTICGERIQKLLDERYTGLPHGLRQSAGSPNDALAILGQGSAAVAAEARLLGAPVSLELPTSSVAASIEDRITMAPLAARRLSEQVRLGLRLATVELVCGAQAIDLRGRAGELGTGTARLHALVREHVPMTRTGEAPALAYDGLTAALLQRGS
jgi:histidine ammonia-lyase